MDKHIDSMIDPSERLSFISELRHFFEAYAVYATRLEMLEAIETLASIQGDMIRKLFMKPRSEQCSKKPT